MKKHEGLVGDKNVYRMKIRAAKKKVAEKKQKKKDFKKTAKKSTADPKKAKEKQADVPLIVVDAGHGGKSGRFRRYREVALEYAFMFDLAGIKK